MGISKTKKIGIDNATGKYITFIDGDDWFEPMALEKMIESAVKYNSDLVIMNNYRCYFGYKKKQPNAVTKYDTPFFDNEIIDDYYISFFGINKISVTYWGKLYRTEIIRQSHFTYDKHPIGEDLLFNAHIFPLLKTMTFIDYFGYNWRYGGITSSKMSFEQIKTLIYNFKELYIGKKRLADSISFHKAYRPMAVELKNVLLSNFSQIAEHPSSNNQSQPVKDLIKEIINIDVYYNSVCSLLNDEKYVSDSFIKAISKKDYDTIYNLCYNTYKRDWKRRFAKYLLSLINKCTKHI